MVAIAGDWVITIDPATEQMGHMCGLAGPEVRSAHMWNCAARKMIQTNGAKSQRRFNLLDLEIGAVERRLD
jgi:hypothetical protein